MLGDRAKNSILCVFPEFFLVPVDSYLFFLMWLFILFTQWDVLSGYVLPSCEHSFGNSWAD